MWEKLHCRVICAAIRDARAVSGAQPIQFSPYCAARPTVSPNYPSNPPPHPRRSRASFGHDILASEPPPEVIIVLVTSFQRLRSTSGVPKAPRPQLYGRRTQEPLPGAQNHLHVPFQGTSRFKAHALYPTLSGTSIWSIPITSQPPGNHSSS